MAAQEINTLPQEVMPPPPPVEGNMPPPGLLSQTPEQIRESNAVPIAAPPQSGPSNIPPTPPVGQEPVVVSPPPRRGVPKFIFGILGVIVLVLIVIGLLKVIPSLLNRTQLQDQEITWWGLWEDTNIVNSVISEYQQSHPNIKIKYVRQSKEDYRERLTNAIAQGKGPDVFRFHNSWVPMFKNELDNVPNSVMSSAEFSQTYYPVIQSDLSSGGAFKGIPLDFDTLSLFVNEELFETYGKSVPTNWDELRQTALDLTIKDGDNKITQSGVSLGRTENVDHWPEILGLMMLQNGVTMTKPEGELAEGALKFYTIFSREDKVWDETLPPSTIAFANGKVAMYFGPSWRYHEIKNINPTLKFKIYPVPQLPQEEGTEPRNVSYATYWVEGVWKRSKVREASWEFLKYVSTKESLEKLYESASRTRQFGEPYPRIEMATLLANDPVVGPFIRQAPFAQSWYLQSRTWDGPTGINTQLTKYYEDAINAVNQGKEAKNSLIPVQQGVIQVLSQYGIVQAPPPTPAQ